MRALQFLSGYYYVYKDVHYNICILNNNLGVYFYSETAVGKGRKLEYIYSEK